VFARVQGTLADFPLLRAPQVDVARHLAEEYGDRAWGVCSMAKPTGLRFPVHGNRIDPVYPYIDAGARPFLRVSLRFSQSEADSQLLNSRHSSASLPLVFIFSTRPISPTPSRLATRLQRSPGPAAANTPRPPST
jgi:hypothetical protein